MSTSAAKRLKQKCALIRTRSLELFWRMKKMRQTNRETAEALHPTSVMSRRYFASLFASENKNSLVWRKLTRTAKFVRCRHRQEIESSLTIVRQPSVDHSDASKSQNTHWLVDSSDAFFASKIISSSLFSSSWIGLFFSPESLKIVMAFKIVTIKNVSYLSCIDHLELSTIKFKKLKFANISF